MYTLKKSIRSGLISVAVYTLLTLPNWLLILFGWGLVYNTLEIMFCSLAGIVLGHIIEDKL